MQREVCRAQIAQLQNLHVHVHVIAARIHYQLNKPPADVALTRPNESELTRDSLRYSYVTPSNDQSVPVSVQRTDATAWSGYPRHFCYRSCGLV